MDTQATLSVAADIGIGVAGFSSIAAAILSRSVKEDLDVFWFQLRTLLMTSLAVVLLAYFPMVLGSTDLTHSTTWHIGSAVYALWALFVIATGFSGLSRLLSVQGVVKHFAVITLILGLVSLTLNTVNAVYIGDSWPYLAALSCGITIAFMQFGLLVHGLWQARELFPEESS